MTTAEMLTTTAHSSERPAWAERGVPHVISTRVGFGNIEKAAGDLERAADLRNANIVEVHRVLRGSLEAVFARLEPKVNPT